MNDVIVTNQMRSISRFKDAIKFNDLTNVMRVDSIEGGLNAFAMQSDQLIFGWVVNPETDVTSERIRIYEMVPGQYRLKLFHTWSGRWIEERELMVENGSIEFQVPNLRIQGGQARYVGQDIAFILERM